jgi:hypothetical protein
MGGEKISHEILNDVEMRKRIYNCSEGIRMHAFSTSALRIYRRERRRGDLPRASLNPQGSLSAISTPAKGCGGRNGKMRPIRKIREYSYGLTQKGRPYIAPSGILTWNCSNING